MCVSLQDIYTNYRKSHFKTASFATSFSANPKVGDQREDKTFSLIPGASLEAFNNQKQV